MFGLFSIWHLAILAVGGWVLFSIFGSRRTPIYVITEWFASETANEDGIHVRIKGRKGGLLSFALSSVGINPTVSLVVDRENVRFMAGSWNGFDSWVTPIGKVCSGNYGYNKPFWGTAIWVLMGIFMPMLDFSAGMLLASLVWIALGVTYYFLHKTTKVVLVYISGGTNGFAFKRSIIEGENIDEIAAGRIISIIEMITLGKGKLNPVDYGANEQMAAGVAATEKARQKMDALKAQAMHAGEVAASKIAASLASASENTSRPGSAPEKCPGCGESIKAADTFCGNCGRPLR